jgi:hypothetical protein
MNFNTSPLKQVYIPLSKPGGFKDLNAAKVHREVVAKAQELRDTADETIGDLKSADVADIGSTPSDEWTDLAAGKGHVIMVGDNDDGTVRGVELRYNPENGDVRSFTADVPQGKLTQGISSSEEGISPTYKWEENKGGQVETTYFKFDDKAGVLAILDPNNQTPSILKGVNPKEIEGGFIMNPLTIFPF